MQKTAMNNNPSLAIAMCFFPFYYDWTTIQIDTRQTFELS